MLNIKQIDHLVLRVKDIDTMLEFYTKVLTCTLERSREDLGLYHLRAGASMIDLVPVDGTLGNKGGAAPGDEALNLDHFCLQIEPFDADQIKAHLNAHGVQVSDAQLRFGAKGDGPSMYLQDPEGNTVELKGPPEL